MKTFRYNKCAWTFFFFVKKTKRQSVFLSQYVNMFHVKPFCLKGNRLRSVGLARYSQYNAVQIYIIFIWRRTWGSALVLFGKINETVFLKPKCEGARVPGWEDARDHRPPVCMREDCCMQGKVAAEQRRQTFFAYAQFHFMHIVPETHFGFGM